MLVVVGQGRVCLNEVTEVKTVLTILELNRDGLVGAFHEESRWGSVLQSLTRLESGTLGGDRKQKERDAYLTSFILDVGQPCGLDAARSDVLQERRLPNLKDGCRDW